MNLSGAAAINRCLRSYLCSMQRHRDTAELLESGKCQLRGSAPRRAATSFRPASSASLRAAGSPRSRFPLAHPGLADGQGCSTLHPPIQGEDRPRRGLSASSAVVRAEVR
jgi:hypothetical protein